MLAKRFNQNGKVIILSETTDEPISLIGEMAGICWEADISNYEKNFNRGLDCIKCNHGRTMEYPQVYALISGYSARVIRELYTHIGGAPTRLQESTRYVDSSNFNYIIPPSIVAHDEAREIYENMMKEISSSIEKLEKLNIKREDSAMLLPLGSTTKVVIRTNLRNLIDMSYNRECNRALWEFRELFGDWKESLRIYSDQWKYLIDEVKVFKPKCELLGRCPEKYSCGRYSNKEGNNA